MSEWFAHRCRRHLCDMHINDWSEDFLSRFDPAEYVKNLDLAQVDLAMIYLQSHVGLCYFPTKTARMHRAFEKEPDRMRRLVTMCHERDIRVMGYYSLIFNRLAHDEHPDWVMLDAEGRDCSGTGSQRHGFCCPNSLDYRAFVFEQVREMLDYVDVDGLFFDMPFWPVQCYCPACRGRWAREETGPMPRGENDEGWERMLAARRRWMGEFAQAVTDCAKGIRPDLIVEHNFANAIAGNGHEAISDGVNEACDYTGGDLYGGLPAQSFTCKYYDAVTKNKPFEYMTARCPTLYKHTVSLTQRELDTAVMLTAAHHGASLIIDAIDPVGTMDERVYRRIGAAYELQKPYERYFEGERVCDAAVLYHLPAKVRRRGQGFSLHDCALQASKTLVRSHVPTGVVTYRQFAGLNSDTCPLLIAGYPHSLGREGIDALVNYVINGGRLYLSGGEEPELVEKLLDAKIEGLTEHTYTYVAPVPGREELFAGFNGAYPLPAEESAALIGALPEDAEVLACLTLPYTEQGTTRFASIHSNPPGVPTERPAVVRRRVGAGEVLWCAVPLEREEQSVYGEVLMNLLRLLGLRPRLETTASAVVETTLFDNHGYLQVNAVRLNSDFEGDLPPFTVSVVCAEPKAVVLLPSGTPVPFSYENDRVSFEARALDLFDMYEIQADPFRHQPAEQTAGLVDFSSMK